MFTFFFSSLLSLFSFMFVFQVNDSLENLSLFGNKGIGAAGGAALLAAAEVLRGALDAPPRTELRGTARRSATAPSPQSISLIFLETAACPRIS